MKMLNKKKTRPVELLLLMLLLPLLLTGCTTVNQISQASCSLYELPPDLSDASINDSVIKYFSSGLKGKVIFLDPGHGGSDKKSKSPNGLVTEADINLRVGLYLRDFLSKAGVKVLMSRDTDKTVDLKERTRLANESDAQFFISIHHNAPGKDSDRYTNYSSTYYHATEDDYEHHPSNRDLAKYINRDLAFNTGRPAGLASFDGTVSDYLIYPGDGFSVLRTINIPAVLVECSFFTNLNEEIRLSDTTYNKLEAWGIFKGMGRYFRAATPQLSMKKKQLVKGKVELQVEINSKQEILARQVKIYKNKEILPEKEFSVSKNLLTINLGDSWKKETVVKIIVTNKSGLSNLPFILTLTPEVN